MGPDGHIFFGEAHIDLIHGVVFAFNLLSSVPLQNKVRYYNQYTIDWTLTYRGSIQQSFPAGKTMNRLYVTIGDPVGDDRLFESMVQLSCGAADGIAADEPLDIADPIWGRLPSLDVSRKLVDGFNFHDGNPLFYWGPDSIPGKGTTAAALLNRGWGTCGAWSELLHSCMTLQGIGGTRVTLTTWDRDPLFEDILLVREFSITHATYPFLKYPYREADFMDEDGIPAQNNFDPQTFSFQNHCINFYLLPEGFRLLDPSYGVLAPSLESYEGEALFALGRYPDPDHPTFRIYRKQDIGIRDLAFGLFQY